MRPHIFNSNATSRYFGGRQYFKADLLLEKKYSLAYKAPTTILFLAKPLDTRAFGMATHASKRQKTDDEFHLIYWPGIPGR